MDKLRFKAQEILVIQRFEEMGVVTVITAKRPDQRLWIVAGQQQNIDMLKYKPGDIVHCWAHDGQLCVEGRYPYTKSTPDERIKNIVGFHSKYIAPALEHQCRTLEMWERHTGRTESASAHIAIATLEVSKERTISAENKKDVRQVLDELRADLSDAHTADTCTKHRWPGMRMRTAQAIQKDIQGLEDFTSGRRTQENSSSTQTAITQRTLEEWCP